MRNAAIIGVPQFVVQFTFVEFKVLFDCARNHYSADVRRQLDRADGHNQRNGLITQMENYFSNMANYDGSHVCVMNLSFRDVDLFLKTMEAANASNGRWREREFLAVLEMNSLFRALLESANRLDWKTVVRIGMEAA